MCWPSSGSWAPAGDSWCSPLEGVGGGGVGDSDYRGGGPQEVGVGGDRSCIRPVLGTHCDTTYRSSYAWLHHVPPASILMFAEIGTDPYQVCIVAN